MISLRLAASAVLIAAAIAGCITYFATPGSPQRIEADPRMPPADPGATGRPASGVTTNIQRPSTEDNITAYQRAADALVKGSKNARASADVPLVTGRIPLPKRRPILRP